MYGTNMADDQCFAEAAGDLDQDTLRQKLIDADQEDSDGESLKVVSFTCYQ